MLNVYEEHLEAPRGNLRQYGAEIGVLELFVFPLS